jgi:hypothetical protein
MWKWVHEIVGAKGAKQSKLRDASAATTQGRDSVPSARTEQSAGRSRGPTYIVGLDYGTHSTKIVVRRRDASRGEVLVLDPPKRGENDEYPWFAVPSLVRVTGRKLRFGRSALVGEGELHKSLKVKLLDSVADRADDAAIEGARREDLLVASYLAWVLGGVRAKLREKIEGVEPRILLNLAAPMNHFEDKGLKVRYLRIIHAAWAAAFETDGPAIAQGIELDAADAILGPRLLPDCPIPDSSERPFEVLPETVAPLVSLSRNPDCEPGLYAVVDVGAGTTEISVTHVGEPDADQKILCYGDESFLLGGDKLAAAQGNHEIEAHLAREFLKTLRRIWMIGYRKDAPSHSARPRWKRLTILRTGGAGRHRAIESQLALGHPAAAKGQAAVVEVDRYEWQIWYEPVLEVMGVGNPRVAKHLLAVADGLSSERMNWPEWFRPADIEALQSEPIRETDPTWYIE